MLILPRMDGNDPATATTATRFAADAAAVATAVATAHRFGAAAGLAADPMARLAIVVEELVANLVEHGGAPGSSIELHLACHPREVALRLTDAGAWFDPREATTPLVPPARGGGAGLALVRAWARIVGYARAGGRNRLDLALPLDE